MSATLQNLNTALSGRYAVEREIGQGGMASVFLARDLKHDRRVALKLLRPDLGAVLGAERFTAEIRVTAGLHHPNLLPLFDSGAADGSLFYVMPYVEGESLRSRLDRERQLPVDEAVRLTVAIAGALDYAHQRGVIHRDLKPENILLAAGQPVVADFGIALAISNAGGARVTQTGLSLGTPQYMSPEQASGDRQIDARTDIYSLGAVLYEMLTGDPPHTGSTAQAIIARLMTETPRPVSATRHTVPPHVEAAVERSLQKLPADRFASAAEFATALTSPAAIAAYATRGTRAAGAVPPPRSRRELALRALPWTLAGIAALLLITRFGPDEPLPDPPVRFVANTGTSTINFNSSPAISPDGSMLAYPGVDSTRAVWLYIHALDRETPVLLGGERQQTNSPFFSPDGREVGFLRDGRLEAISVAGGATRLITPMPHTWQLATWGEKGEIVYGGDGYLWRVPATGGQPTRLVATDSSADRLLYGAPHFLPGAEMLVAERQSKEGTELVSVRLSDARVTPLGIYGSAPQYVSTGWLVYVEPSGTMVAVPFDAGRAKVRGTPTPVRLADRVMMSPHGRVAVSRNGTIAYLASRAETSRSLVVIDRSGAIRATRVPPGLYRFPRLSADGKRIVVVQQVTGRVTGNVWTFDLATGRGEQLTFDSTTLVAEWAPGEREIYYTRRWQGESFALFKVSVNGETAPEQVFTGGAGGVSTPAFHPDGKRFVYATIPRGNWELWTSSFADTATRRRIADANFDGTGTAISPDGKWLAYNSSTDGRWSVFLRRADRPSGRWPVSVNGGSEPRWSANGKELIYRNLDSVRVVSFTDGGDVPILGAPRALFANNRYLAWPTEVHYDVTRDGQTFVFVTGTQGSMLLNVMLNRLDRPPP